MISLAVAAPGRSGRPSSSQAAIRRSVAPGETPKVAPAAFAALTSAGVKSVPAPTMPPGTSAMARIASSATGVRSVTSSAGRPPATSASARGRACARSSITSTGTTGARRQISAALADCWAGVMAAPSGPGVVRGGWCGSLRRGYLRQYESTGAGLTPHLGPDSGGRQGAFHTGRSSASPPVP